MLPAKERSWGRRAGKPGGSVAAPDDQVGGGLDIIDAVAVGEVPREVAPRNRTAG